ncbi:hypothetical protein KTAU_30260 [Thermogemmatispora aurantia]|uniref:hypothetical protein n=1 Tax=Thermogemmatispora aurantia TaxID=2045279 RepID=UPI00124D3EA0|nr:hypothetical protein [Thermogemmatispora aurantia]GER84390.1 hypothetical protein KTAU_30260 [Thermogemmatispora aurantia]
MKIRQQPGSGVKLELVRRLREQEPTLAPVSNEQGESPATWRHLEEAVATLGQAEEQAEAMEHVSEVWQAIAAARSHLAGLPPARAWQILLWPFRRELAALALASSPDEDAGDEAPACALLQTADGPPDISAWAEEDPPDQDAATRHVGDWPRFVESG